MKLVLSMLGLSVGLLLPGSSEAQTCSPTPDTLGSTPEEGVYQWPAACYRFHDTANDPFTRELSSTLKRADLQHSNSSLIVQQLLESPLNELQGRGDGQVGEPTYYSLPTDPEYVIDCDPTADAPYYQECALDGQVVRIPEWARPENGWNYDDVQRGDSHMTVIDRTGGWEWNFYRVWSNPMPMPAPDGKRYFLVGYASRTPLNGDGLYTSRAATAAWFAGTLGRIRLEELQAGEINHALAMVVPCHNTTEGPSRTGGANVGVVYPAGGPGGRKCDGALASKNANAPAMGAHFVYTRTPAEIDLLPLPAWKKTLLKALSRYGAFVSDTGGWAFEQEASYQYSAAVYRGAARWYDFGQANGWQFWTGENTSWTGDDRYFGKLISRNPDGSLDADSQVIDLQQYLKVLQPCVSQGTCT